MNLPTLPTGAPAQAKAPAPVAPAPVAAPAAAQPNMLLDLTGASASSGGPPALFDMFGHYRFKVSHADLSVARSGLPMYRLYLECLDVLDPASHAEVKPSREYLLMLNKNPKVPEIFANEVAKLVAAIFDPELAESKAADPTLKSIDMNPWLQHSLSAANIEGRVMEIMVKPRKAKSGGVFTDFAYISTALPA